MKKRPRGPSRCLAPRTGQPPKDDASTWGSTGHGFTVVSGAKVADCARTTQCRSVHYDPSGLMVADKQSEDGPASCEDCSQSPFVRPVSGSGHTPGADALGGNGSSELRLAEWHGGCYSSRGGRLYGSMAELRGAQNVRGQRVGGWRVPGGPDWGGSTPGTRRPRRPNRPVPAPSPFGMGPRSSGRPTQR